MIRTILAGVYLAIFSVAAHAQCDAVFVSPAQLVGHTAWLARNKPERLPVSVDKYKGLKIPILKQIGPHNWDPDGDRSLVQGLQVSVVEIVEFHDGAAADLARYVRVETGGARYVVESDNIIGFDFTQCEVQHLLGEKLYENHSGQLMDALPMVPREGARPTDHLGRWVDERLLRQLVMVDCYEYGHNSLIHDDVVECSPVWGSGVNGFKNGLPLKIYYKPDELQQITTPPPSQ